MDQLDIAIHQTAHDAPGGLEALARRMGVHAQVLRNKVCPTTDTHKLNLREALAMMELTGNDSILQVIAALRGYTLTRCALPAATSIIEAVLSADGKLTESERSDITQQIKRAHDTLDALNSTVLHAPTLLKQQG